jgi:hypothetical protein
MPKNNVELCALYDNRAARQYAPAWSAGSSDRIVQLGAKIVEILNLCNNLVVRSIGMYPVGPKGPFIFAGFFNF